MKLDVPYKVVGEIDKKLTDAFLNKLVTRLYPTKENT
jgi:hypothetical protein